MFITRALNRWIKRFLDSIEPPLRDEDNLSGGVTTEGR